MEENRGEPQAPKGGYRRERQLLTKNIFKWCYFSFHSNICCSNHFKEQRMVSEAIHPFDVHISQSVYLCKCV